MDRPKVVVITGASAGVGRAAARAFAREGAHVGLVARGHERLEAASREIEAAGRRAVKISADVSNANQIEAAATEAEKELGPIDVWVNNAMTSVFSPVKEMSADEFKRVTEVTYLGCVYGTLAALRRMLPRDCGVIVQVGSALAYRSIPLQSAYCAAKHAIQGFTEALRTELLHDGSRVRVTTVHLPALNTPQFRWVKSRLSRKPQPVPPIFQPEVAAEAIVWAAKHPRREMRVGFSTVQAVLGNKLAPGLMDHYLARFGYEAQQYDGLDNPNRPNNLWVPVPGDFGAHGDFDDRAKETSFQFWADTHREILAWAGVAALGLLSAAVWARRKLPGTGKSLSSLW